MPGRPPRDVVLLLISLFLAFALEPAANVLSRRGWRRGLATAAVFALPAASSVQALISTYLHRYDVVASPLTGASG